MEEGGRCRHFCLTVLSADKNDYTHAYSICSATSVVVVVVVVMAMVFFMGLVLNAFKTNCTNS